MPSPANAWEGEEEEGLQLLLPVLRRRMLGNPHDRWEATSEELEEEEQPVGSPTSAFILWLHLVHQSDFIAYVMFPSQGHEGSFMP